MALADNLWLRYSQVFISGACGKRAESVAVYAKRRRELLQEMDSFCVFAGMPHDPGTEESFASTWTRFVQDPAFLFLTGINEAGCFLLLDPLAKNPAHREILFVPCKDPSREFWFGLRIGYTDDLREIRRLTGFRTILPAEKFEETLRNVAAAHAARKFCYAFYLEFRDAKNRVKRVRGDHNEAFAKRVRRIVKPSGIELRPVARTHFGLRVVLDPGRIADARNAQTWTRDAFISTLPEIPHLGNERALGLVLDYRMQSASDGDLAFPTIVAGGRNACCLHYAKKDEPLRNGDLVLMDFGIRAGTQHSDISRTVPVSGKFDPLQKLLYEIVLDAQAFHEAQVKPGEKLRELDRRVWKFILDELAERFTARGGKYTLCYDKRPHGVSHLIGEQIHEGDPFRLYMDRPLVPGMMLSDEPGLYGHFKIKMNGKMYDEWIGIRIEDDLLVTARGCENLSVKIPKTVAAIELAMRKSK